MAAEYSLGGIPGVELLNKARLIQVLDPIASALRGQSRANMIGIVLAYEASVNSPRSDPSVRALFDAIREEPELKIFDGMMQITVNAASRTEYYQLALWLMGRARDADAETAVDDLQRYVDADHLPCETTLVLAGIDPEATIDLGGGMSLINWESVPDSPQKESFGERVIHSFGLNMPTAAIVRPFSIPKRHIAPDEYKMDLVAVDDVALQDALSCVSVVGPSAVQFLAYWIRLPEWAPAVGSGMALPHVEGRAFPKKFSVADGAEAKELLSKFQRLPEPERAHLKLVMHRLGQAMRRFTPVDAAIDLGIALESMFLNDQNDDRGELTFRLKLRMARFLGVDVPDRKRIHGLVGHVYKARSVAVHTGVVPPTVAGLPVQKILDDGCGLAADAIRRMIRSGQPAWDDVQFG